MSNRRLTTSHRNPPTVPPVLQEALRQVVATAAVRNEQWTVQDVAIWLGDQLGHPVSYHLGRRYLVRIKHSLQAPLPRHAVADAKLQDTVKNFRPLMRQVATAFPLAQFELWAMDEQRIGLKPLLLSLVQRLAAIAR